MRNSWPAARGSSTARSARSCPPTGGCGASVLADGTVVDREVLVVAAPVRVSSPVLDDLGIVREPVVLGDVEVGDRYPSGPGGATSVPGVHLAGNVTDPQAQVVTAAAAGLMAGAAVNADLIAEETAAAVAAFRA